MSDFTYEKKNVSDSPYETYEWDNMWIEHTEEKTSTRVAYIGDSISCGTRRIATAQTNNEILFDGFGSSKALDNPYYKETLQIFFNQLPDIQTIIYNNGLHGWHLSDEKEYEEYYEDMIKFLLTIPKKSKLYIALTTSVADKESNDRVIIRNKVVKKLAEKYSLPVIDLYSVTVDKYDMMISDGVHPTDDLYGDIAHKIIQEITK